MDESTQVNVTNQEISQIINPRQVIDLPTLTRNPYDFVVLAGNTTQDPNGSTGRGVLASLNRQRAAGTEGLPGGVQKADSYDADLGQTISMQSRQADRNINEGFQ